MADDPVTKDDLNQVADHIIDTLRAEFDSKLEAAKTELKTHTEQVVTTHSIEVTQAIANLVRPLEKPTATPETNL